MTNTPTRSTMSSDFIRTAGTVRLDIFNAWQAGAFVGDVNGKPAKWAVYERPIADDTDITYFIGKNNNPTPAYLSLRKSDAINWLITRQETLEENAEVEE